MPDPTDPDPTRPDPRRLDPLDRDALEALAGRLVGVPGVAAVALGGSRARGDHTGTSDVDLGLYDRAPLDVAALTVLAREVAGLEAELTEPGGWGPWVDGGGWLQIGGTPVDWIYRDLDRVGTSWADAQAGRVQWHTQPGHPLGFPGFIYAGEVALGVVLADPTGELTRLQAATRTYPAPLRDALVAGLWEADFLVAGARKAVVRADATYVAGCAFRALLLAAHALHASAGRWLIQEKGAVAAAGRVPGAPPRFAARAHAAVSAGPDPAALSAALDDVETLLAQTRRVCQSK